MDDIRRGVPVLLDEQDEGLILFPAEYSSHKTLTDVHRYTSAEPALVITAVRAKRLGVITSSSSAVTLTLSTQNAEKFLAQVEQAVMTLTSVPRTLSVNAAPATTIQQAALQLVKMASLLPAALVAPLHKQDVARTNKILQAVHVNDLESYPHRQASTLTLVSEANVPLKEAKTTRVLTFQPRFGTVPHLAVVIGNPDTSKAPLVRLHSSCMTGDILGSLRCDCGEQLHMAIHKMAQEGAGVLLYLNQEGRGIGIANKLRAYTLQDEGLDTVEANEEMGFDADERQFEVAAEILRQLKLPAIRLMTNNIHKVEMLTQYGIKVSERVPLVIPATSFNQAYLDTKAKKCGHIM